jgi:hypothetical protein
VRALVWLVIAACGAPAAQPGSVPAPVTEPPARAVPAPHRPALPPRPVLEGEEARLLRARLRPLELPSERKSDYWSPCVRAFVQRQPEVAREPLGEALSRYGTACSATRVEFRAPRALRGAGSELALVGALEDAACELALRAADHGEPIGADRIALIAGGLRWTSPRLDFERTGDDEVVTIPLTRAMVREIRGVLDGRDPTLRFEGARGRDEIAIGEDARGDLRAMLDALDALGRP